MDRPVVFMTGAGGGMGYESFKAMLPDIGKLYDLVILSGTAKKTITCLISMKGCRD